MEPQRRVFLAMGRGGDDGEVAAGLGMSGDGRQVGGLESPGR